MSPVRSLAPRAGCSGSTSRDAGAGRSDRDENARAAVRSARRAHRVYRAFVPLVLLALGVGACGGDQPVTDPRPISVESPFRYPIDLWDAAVEGEVVVMVHVTAMGHVDSVYVLESSGQPALDSAAVRGARDLAFAPGRRGDRRIAMWAKLPVRFQKPEEPQPGGEE